VCGEKALMTKKDVEIVPQILRDLQAGVLVLDMRGFILYLNAQGRKLLGERRDPSGLKYAAALLNRDDEGKNDDFHQFILDSVYDQNHTRKGEAVYCPPGRRVRRFSLTSSPLRSEDGKAQVGIIVLFTDITEAAKQQRWQRESSELFAVLTLCLCASLFLCGMLRDLNTGALRGIMSLMIQAVSAVMFVLVVETTNFTAGEIGLRIKSVKGTFLPDTLVALAGGALLILGKLFLLRTSPELFPAGAPFWDWSAGRFANVIYPVTVILEEFLVHGVMQESMGRILPERVATVFSVAASALIFGLLHVAAGPSDMLISVLLTGFLGILYHWQGNIWGLCLIRFVLGEMAAFLRY